MDASKKAPNTREMTTREVSENVSRKLNGTNTGTVLLSSADSDFPKNKSSEANTVSRDPSGDSDIIPEQRTVPNSANTRNILKDRTNVSTVHKEPVTATASKIPSAKVGTASKDSSAGVAATVSKDLYAVVDTVSKESSGVGAKDISTKAGIIQTDAYASNVLMVSTIKDGTFQETSEVGTFSVDEPEAFSRKLSSEGIDTDPKEVSPDPIIILKIPTAADESSCQTSDSTLKPLMQPTENIFPSPIHIPNNFVADLKYQFQSTCQKNNERLQFGQILKQSLHGNTPSEINRSQQSSLPSEDSDSNICKSKYKSHADAATAISTPYTNDVDKENQPCETEYQCIENIKSDNVEYASPIAKTLVPVPELHTTAKTCNRGDSMVLQRDNESKKFLQLPPAISSRSSSGSEGATNCSLNSEYESSKEEEPFATISSTFNSGNDNINAVISEWRERINLMPDLYDPSCFDHQPIHFTEPTTPIDIPPLFGWVPPRAKRIVPVGDSHPSRDRDCDSLQSESKSPQHTPVVSPFFNSDSASATDTCSLRSEYESPQYSQRGIQTPYDSESDTETNVSVFENVTTEGTTAISHLYNIRNDSATVSYIIGNTSMESPTEAATAMNFPSEEDDIYKMWTSSEVETGPMTTTSKYENSSKESTSEVVVMASTDLSVKVGNIDNPPLENAATCLQKMSTKSKRESTDDVLPNSDCAASGGSVQWFEDKEPSPDDVYIDIESLLESARYESEKVSSALLDNLYLFESTWKPPKAVRIPRDKTIKVPLSVVDILPLRKYSESDSNE